jgi:hypothetical protein
MAWGELVFQLGRLHARTTPASQSEYPQGEQLHCGFDPRTSV